MCWMCAIIENVITTAIERIEARMDPILNNCCMLVGIRTRLVRLRRRMLRRLHTESQANAEAERQLWNEVR